MKLLVTGSAGFIGSNFVYEELASHRQTTIVGLDALTYAGNLENLDALPKSSRDRFEFIKGDINDAGLVREILASRAIDGVVNFAAESHVDRSIRDAQVFIETNVAGTQTLLDEARGAWFDSDRRRWREGVRFLQVSTDEVYGSLGPEGLFTETTPLDPRSPYSASKAAADLLARACHATHGMPVVITRCSNNYGPYQFPEKLIPLMIRNALRHEPLPVYGDGKQVRDWLHVMDHTAAISLVLRKGEPGAIYNIGGGNEARNIDVILMILKIIGELKGDPRIDASLVTHVEDRLGHDRRYAIDASKLRHELGWEARVSFEQGLRETIRWYLDNQPWVENVVSGDYQRFYEENYGRRAVHQ